MPRRSACLPICTAVLLAGCAAYHPAPLDPQAQAQQLEQRSLQADGLLRFIAAVRAAGESGGPMLPQPAPSDASGNGAPGPLAWDLDTLTLAALYYHPSLAIARGRLREAQAGVRTARALPNPSLGFEELNHTVGGPAAWTVSPVIDFLIETAGKRAHRTQEARALTRAALEDLASASWQVRAGVRDALLGEWAASRRVGLLGEQLDSQTELAALLEHRLMLGEAAAPDAERAQVGAQRLQLALRDAQRQLLQAGNALAQAVGVPVTALQQVTVSFAGLTPPQPPADLARLRREALTGRSDVQALLADYAAAEAALALQVADQYPNVTLGPGFSFDSGADRYILLPQLQLPLFNHNQGPIAAALARRQTAAARFTALQLQVINQVDGALDDYRAAGTALDTAEALLGAEQDLARRTAQSFHAGAIDRPTLLTVQIERSSAAQSRLDVLLQQRRALGALEDALEHPLYFPQARWLAWSRQPPVVPGIAAAPGSF